MKRHKLDDFESFYLEFPAYSQANHYFDYVDYLDTNLIFDDPIATEPTGHGLSDAQVMQIAQDSLDHAASLADQIETPPQPEG